MKTIQPISIWYNGKTEIATLFNLSCIRDNMFNSAIFSFQLNSEETVTITSGNLTMNLPDYSTDWISNDAAYNWAALQLNLIITGEYVPPVPPIEEITPISE